MDGARKDIHSQPIVNATIRPSQLLGKPMARRTFKPSDNDVKMVARLVASALRFREMAKSCKDLVNEMRYREQADDCYRKALSLNDLLRAHDHDGHWSRAEFEHLKGLLA